jgi:hypothetical protein
VISSLGALLADAQEQGLTAHNAVRDLRRNRQRGKERNAEKRQKGKLKVGVDIPTISLVPLSLDKDPVQPLFAALKIPTGATGKHEDIFLACAVAIDDHLADFLSSHGETEDLRILKQLKTSLRM